MNTMHSRDGGLAPPIAALKERAEMHPLETAYYDERSCCTWGQLWQSTQALASALSSLGVDRGDVVALWSADCLATVEHWFACAYLGAIRTAINFRYGAGQVEGILRASAPRVLIVDGGAAAALETLDDSVLEHVTIVGLGDHEYELDYNELLASTSAILPAPVRDNELCAISFTSGTSGTPKGAKWTFRGVHEAQSSTFSQAGLGAGDVFMHCSPSAGVPILSATWNVYTGGTVILRSDVRAQSLIECIENLRVTSTLLVPTLLADLVDSPLLPSADLSSLRLVIYGSAPASESLVRRTIATLNCELQQWYGSTEGTGGWYCILNHDDHLRALRGSAHLLRSCGKPTRHCRVDIIDPDGQIVDPGEIGEITVTGSTVFAGYIESDVAHEPRESLHTGDVGYKDDEGYLYIVDRKQRLIITGGYNVYPSAVEAALLEVRGVQEACVVGIPHKRWGQAVVACVVTREGLDVDTIREELAARVSRFEIPKQILLLDKLPRTQSLKIDYSAVASHFSEVTRA